MIHEEELVFYRDEQSGKPCLGRMDRATEEVSIVIIEDVIGEAIRWNGPVPVLVSYDDRNAGLDMEEAYKKSFRAQMSRQVLMLEDASGRRGRFMKKINSISFPYALALDRDGEEIPMSYGIEGNCSTGRKEDKIVKMILVSQDGTEEVLKEAAASDMKGPEKTVVNTTAEVDSTDFPPVIED